MTDRRDWEGRTGRKWADEWRRTDRAFAGLTEKLLARIRVLSPANVLDIGCGAGELSLAIAREHPAAQVLGVDIAAPLIDTATERGANLPNVRFQIADAATFKPDRPSDLLVSRHGVMFFDDPPLAFTHLRSVAAPDAHLLFSCFRDRSLNPWASEIAKLLPPGAVSPADPRASGPFAFSERDHVERILTEAGWAAVHFEAVDFAYVAGTGDDPLGDAKSFFLSIGPAAAAAVELSPDARLQFIDRLVRFLDEHRSGSIVALPASAWMVTARAQ